MNINKLYLQIQKIINESVYNTYLNEEFGIPEYKNKSYKQSLKKIAKDIIKKQKQLKTPTNFNIQEYQIVNNEKQLVDTISTYRLNYQIDCIDWLNNINIYLTKIPQFNNKENSMLLLNNTQLYNKQIININYEIIQDDISLEPFVISDNKIDTLSILLFMPILYEENILADNLEHELGHAFKLLKSKLTTAQINADLIRTNNFITNTGNYNKEITYLLNNTIHDNAKISFIKNNITYDLISDLFADAIYYMNKDEMQQRRINISNEMNRNKDNIICSILTKEQCYNKISDISESFCIYYNYYKLFKFFIEYVNQEIKKQFVNIDIKTVYASTIKDTLYEKPTYIYGIDFKNRRYNKYTYKAFDMFFNYHIRNIEKIILDKTYKEWKYLIKN